MKAIIFDFDGTLTKSPKGSNCWYKIWKEIDDLETDNHYYDMRKRNEIDDNEWLNLIEKRFIEKNVNFNICKKVSEHIELIEELTETFIELRKKDFLIFILSGGVKPIIELTLKDKKQLVENIEAYDFDFDKNGKLKKITHPFHDLEAKENYVNFVKKAYELSDRDIIFIGNGRNDETVYKSGIKTLCINPDDADFKNTKYWTNYIEKCESLLRVMPFIEKVFYQNDTKEK